MITPTMKHSLTSYRTQNGLLDVIQHRGISKIVTMAVMTRMMVMAMALTLQELLLVREAQTGRIRAMLQGRTWLILK